VAGRPFAEGPAPRHPEPAEGLTGAAGAPLSSFPVTLLPETPRPTAPRAGRPLRHRRSAVLALLVVVLLGAGALTWPPQDGVVAGDALPGLLPADGLDAALLVTIALTRTEYIDSLQRHGAEPAAPWLAAAAAALEGAPTIRAPYAEDGRFTTLPDALGYRVELRAGERLRVELETGAPAELFVELFEGTPVPGRPASRSLAGPGVLEYEARRDGHVLLRLQPRPGAAASYRLVVRRSAALTFPVAGDGATVISHFLESRDAGERRHLGVDIAAPRGTPVMAAAGGTVERVEETELGGRVVWIREPASGRFHFYAHLDRQLVAAGARVAAGDVIGTVGTTGNAPETTPHLHYGVFAGHVALDPLPLLVAADVPQEPEPGDGPAPRTRARTRIAGAALRTSADGTGPAASLPHHTEVEVIATAGRMRRVRTADGVHGFVAGWVLEPLPATPAR
jgi:peptidoglycan LD-endopeptidase LytH